jgi:hypothetical protein
VNLPSRFACFIVTLVAVSVLQAGQGPKKDVGNKVLLPAVSDTTDKATSTKPLGGHSKRPMMVTSKPANE